MNTSKKKIIAGAGALGIVIMLLFAYLFWIQDAEEINVVVDGTFPTKEAPVNPDGSPRTETGSEEFLLPDNTEIPFERVPLIQVSETAGAGAGFYTDSTGHEFVRYVDRENGHIFQFDLKTEARQKISGVTLPGVIEAVWNSKGTDVALRYLDETFMVRTFIASLSPKSDGTVTITGQFLPDSVTSIAPYSAKNVTGFAYTRVFGGGASLFIQEESGVAKEVFRSPFPEWIIVSSLHGAILLGSRASTKETGVVLKIDGESGGVTKMASGALGMSATIDPTGTWLLTSEYADGSMRTFVQNTRAPMISEPVQTSINTLAEKCVWGVKNAASSTPRVFCASPINWSEVGVDVPDSWYRGEVSFSDEFVYFDPITNTPFPLLVPELGMNMPVDAVHPIANHTGEYVVFKNKPDGIIWALPVHKAEAAVNKFIEAHEGE